MVERHCQKKKSKIDVFSVTLLEQQLPRDFTLVIARKYDIHFPCLTIYVLAFSLYTFLQVKHLHSGISFWQDRQSPPPQLNEVPVIDASLTTKIPLCGSNSRNVAGCPCCSKCFI